MELGLGSIRLGLGYDEMAMMVISGGGKCPGGNVKYSQPIHRFIFLERHSRLCQRQIDAACNNSLRSELDLYSHTDASGNSYRIGCVCVVCASMFPALGVGIMQFCMRSVLPPVCLMYRPQNSAVRAIHRMTVT